MDFVAGIADQRLSGMLCFMRPTQKHAQIIDHRTFDEQRASVNFRVFVCTRMVPVRQQDDFGVCHRFLHCFHVSTVITDQ